MRYARRLASTLLACALATAAGVAMAQPAKAEVHNTPGFVHIQNGEAKTCIDAQDGGPGTRIVTWRCLNTEFEEWQVVQTRIPGNRYEHCACTTVLRFFNHAVNMCMAVANGSSASGTAVVQQNCDAFDETQWWTYDQYNGFLFSFISKKALDVDLGRPDNGVPLQIWTYNPLGSNQRWGMW